MLCTGPIQSESFQEGPSAASSEANEPGSPDSESESATATMPRSGGGGGRSSSGCYVDNAANRSLGRVGMAYGTAVVR